MDNKGAADMKPKTVMPAFDWQMSEDGRYLMNPAMLSKYTSISFPKETSTKVKISEFKIDKDANTLRLLIGDQTHSVTKNYHEFNLEEVSELISNLPFGFNHKQYMENK